MNGLFYTAANNSTGRLTCCADHDPACSCRFYRFCHLLVCHFPSSCRCPTRPDQIWYLTSIRLLFPFVLHCLPTYFPSGPCCPLYFPGMNCPWKKTGYRLIRSRSYQPGSWVDPACPAVLYPAGMSRWNRLSLFDFYCWRAGCQNHFPIDSRLFFDRLSYSCFLVKKSLIPL